MAETITQYANTYDRTTAALDEDDTLDDGIQHGIDDNPNGDAEKGATMGGVGGAVVGMLAGAAGGPLGAIAGAIIGGVAGGVASGAAVGAIDRHDNDNTISGLGTADTYATTTDPNYVAPATGTYATGSTFGDTVRNDAYAVRDDLRTGYDTLRNDLRGDTDTVRGDINNTRAAADSGIGMGLSRETELGERTPSFKTGGVANDGTPDTRGLGEKFVDGLTGDDVDDKTGSVVNHP